MKRRTGRRRAAPRSETPSSIPWQVISRNLALMRSQGCGIDDNSFRRRPKRRAGSPTRLRMTARSLTSASGTRDWRLDAAVAARDGALAAFPDGVDAALTAARSALAAAIKEKEEVAAGFASLEREIDARKKHIDAALSGARTRCGTGGSGRRDCARTSDDGKDRPRGGTRAAHRIAKTARRREYGRSRGAAPGGGRPLTMPCLFLIGWSATRR